MGHIEGTSEERRRQSYQQFVTQPENTINLEFHREPEEGVGFSQECFEEMTDMFLAFVAARTTRAFETVTAPGKLVVSVRVEMT